MLMKALVLVLGLLVFGLGVWLLLEMRRGKRLLKAMEMQSAELLRLAGEVDRIAEVAKSEERRRVEVVESIAEVLRQRDEWKEMFHRAGTGHGAAQQMLMREIARLSAVAKSNGAKNADISPTCLRVVKQYQTEIVDHTDPKKASRIAGADRDPTTANTVETPQSTV